MICQDCRGRYASEGEFQSFQTSHTQEAEDGYDSVEWLAAQAYRNGRVGLMGSSHPGWLAWEAASAQPPHLVAMPACTIPTEITDLDFPGAFKPARRLHWWLNTIAPDLRRRAAPGDCRISHQAGADGGRFGAGHRIRLEITSSVPNHDRNHNTGKDDLGETELIPARQAVHHSTDFVQDCSCPWEEQPDQLKNSRPFVLLR